MVLSVNRGVFRVSYRSIITASDPSTSWLHPFGIKDERGREIGAKVITYRVVFSAADASRQMFYREAPGTAWLVYVQPTRDGTMFGASTARKYVRSEAERDAEIERRLSEMRKRYLAKYAA